MSVEQAIVTVLVALIGAMGGMAVERSRQRREREKEQDSGAASIEEARIKNEGERRKELDEVGQQIREYLQRQVKELSDQLGRFENVRATEREKWNEMLAQLSVKNLEFELQRKRDVAHIAELEEEAQQVDDVIKTLRVRINTLEADGMILAANLDQQTLERHRLERKLAEERVK